MSMEINNVEPTFDNKLSPYTDVFSNTLPNKNSYRSENPNTFSVARFFSFAVSKEKDSKSYSYNISTIVKNKYLRNNFTWRTMEYDNNPSWSLDEKISTLAYFCYTGQMGWAHLVPYLPSWRNSSKWSWFRPDVLAYTFGCRNEWARQWIWDKIIMTKIGMSFDKFYKDPKRYSSGIQLAFIMAMGWGKLGFVMRYETEIREAMFWYYKHDFEHPTVIAWTGVNFNFGEE